jgi:hypothetical protein
MSMPTPTQKWRLRRQKLQRQKPMRSPNPWKQILTLTLNLNPKKRPRQFRLNR